MASRSSSWRRLFIQSLCSSIGLMSKNTVHTHPRRRSRLVLEILENRLAPAIVLVTPNNLNGWQLTASDDNTAPPQPSALFESGPATPPLGAGSLELRISTAGADAAQARNPNFGETLLNNLSALRYSTFVEQNNGGLSGNGGQAPYIILSVDNNNDAVSDDLLFFEPLYQDASFFPSNPQGPLALTTWQTWDALAGGWYSLNGAGGSGPGTNVKPFSTFFDPDGDTNQARIVNTATGLGGLRLVTGFGGPADWGNFIGNIDNVTVNTNLVSNTYDFDLPSVVYVDDNFPNPVPGQDPDGAGPAQNFGQGSFATIQGGVNGVAPGGTVTIAAGVYAESVAVNKSGLTLDGSGSLATDVVIDPLAGDGITVSGNAVTIRDLRVTGAGAGIVASNVTPLTLSNLLLDANTTGGILTNVAAVDFTASPNADIINVDGDDFSATGVQSIAYTGVADLAARGGAGADTFNVDPPALTGTDILIDGGDPAAPASPGDTLIFDAQGQSVDDTGSTVTANGFEPVDYTNIETLNLQNVSGGLVVNGGGGDDTFRLFVDPALGPAYQINNGPLTALGGAASLTFNGADGNDTMIVDLTGGDPIPAGDMIFNGGSQAGVPGDSLEVIGAGNDVGFYNPSPTTPGDGSIQIVGKGTVVFTGLEPTTVSGMSVYTLITPNSDDVLTIDSPAAGRNRISGTSGGVAFEALTFFDVATFILDAETNDGALPNDQVTLNAAGLVATGLVNFSVNTGAGSDTLTVQSASYATPGSASGFSFDGGAGTDVFFGVADISFTLTDTQLTSSAGGSINFTSVDLVDLTDGASANQFRLDFSGGVNVVPSAGVNLHSVGGNDSVRLLDGGGFSADTIAHSYGTTLGDGLIDVDGRNVNYFGVAEALGVLDQLAANNRIFNFTSASENIQITDDATPGDGISRIRASAEAVFTSYRNPTVQITVNGGGGSDSFTNPTFDTLGAPPTANLNGRDGAVGAPDAIDSFTITPSAVTTFNIDADNPAPPTSPGDSLSVTTAGTANPFLTIAGGGSGFSGSFTFADRQPVNFQEIETIANTVNLTITKQDSADPVTAGTTVNYTIVVSNNGPLGIAGVAVADTFPATLSNVTYTSSATGGAAGNTAAGSGNINDTVSLPIGSTITYAVSATVAANAIGTLTNTATVAPPAGITDTDPSDNSSTATTTLNAFADLVVTKSDAPDPARVAENITYTITLRNDGPSDAQGVSLVDDLPTHTGFVSFTAPAGFATTTPAAGSAGKVRATTPTLPAGAVATFTLVVRVDAQAPANGPLVNAVNVAGTTTDASPGNNSATATTAVAHVSFIAIGAVKGSAPRVAVLTPGGARVASFLAFHPAFRAGVRVAVGDVNGDGVSDIIVAAGPGAGPHVKIVDGTKLAGLSPSRTVPNSALLGSFFAYQKGFTGGVFVAAGDVDGDGRDDIITGQGAGSRGRVKVIDADRRQLRLSDGRISFSALHGTFLPYRPSFKGGVVVAAGDVNGDDRADVITGPASGAAPVTIVNMADGSLLAGFFVHAPHAPIGVTLAAGFVNGDDRADIIIGAGAGVAPFVRVIDGTRVGFVDVDGRITPHAALAVQRVFERTFRGGVQVGALDVDGDGLAEILAAFGPTKRRVVVRDVLRSATERMIVAGFDSGSLGAN